VSGFVKICGMTDARAVQAALEAGADAIGFVFAPSVRQVSPQEAAQLALPARGRALCVAVTQHPSVAQLNSIFDLFKPDVLQTDADDMHGIEMPPGVGSWPVLRAMNQPAGAAPYSGRMLFEGPRSGAGKVADWSAARALARSCELILAGGLSAANVAEAIASVRPFGVDVSSGVEEAPGQKSRALIGSFVATARAAFARLAEMENQESGNRKG
jgi:phosphoribosylanthranilate isomerase